MVSRFALTEQRSYCWLSLAVSVLLPVTSLGTAENLVALRGRSVGSTALHRQVGQSNSNDGPSFDDGPQTPCSCDCCDVVRRLPGEVAFGTGIKCNPSREHSADLCPSQCQPSKEDKVLQDDLVDLERFCFFECKPASGPKAPEKSQCVSFSEQEAKQTVDPAGNPIDPAFLYADKALFADKPPALFWRNGPPSANLLSRGTRVQHGAWQDAPGPAGAPAAPDVVAAMAQAPAPAPGAGPGPGPAPGPAIDPDSPDAVDDKEAEKAAKTGKKQAKEEGADARKQAAQLREMENLKQTELNKALKASGNGVVTLNPFAAIQDLDTAAINARVSAQNAAIEASKAVSAYDGGRQKIWKMALTEAGKEVMRWKKYAEEKTKNETEARFAPTWQSKALKAAQKASQPYVEGLLRAQESVKLYQEKGFAMASQSQELWKEAQADAAKANELPRNTIAQANLANSDILDAREKAKEAQDYAVEAKQYFQTAADVRKGIPVFQFNAQKAAAQAVAAMNMPR